jgi:hypothetical protein
MNMRSFISFLLSLFATALLFGQSTSEKILAGSWKYHSFTYKKKTTKADSSSAYFMNFFIDSVYQSDNRVKSDTIINQWMYGAKWYIKNMDSIILLDQHMIRPSASNYGYTSGLQFRLVSDTELQLISGDRKKYFSTYKKVPLRPQVPDTFVKKEDPRYVFAFYNYFLVNIYDSTRKFRIRNVEAAVFTLQPVMKDPLVTNYGHTVSGWIREMTDSTLEVDADNETEIKTNDQKQRTTITRERSFYDTAGFTQNDRVSIDLRTIKYMQYSGPSRSNWHTAAGLMLTLSSVTALLIAPLVSVNYRNGNFNSQRYYGYTLCGLGGIAVGIPISLSTRPKNYRITGKNNNGNKELWYFKKEVDTYPYRWKKH